MNIKLRTIGITTVLVNSLILGGCVGTGSGTYDSTSHYYTPNYMQTHHRHHNNFNNVNTPMNSSLGLSAIAPVAKTTPQINFAAPLIAPPVVAPPPTLRFVMPSIGLHH